MTLQLIKIQEGVGEGSVLFHSFVHKTEEELQAILAAKEEKLRLKAQRQDQQAQNVQRKQERREAHKSVVGRWAVGWGPQQQTADRHPLLQEEESGGHEESMGRR